MVFDAGHESCDVPLCVKLESLHCRMELRSGCYVDVIVDLEVQEFGTLECMVFIRIYRTDRSVGDLGMMSQFNIQAVVGASETKRLGSEVGGGGGGLD